MFVVGFATHYCRNCLSSTPDLQMAPAEAHLPYSRSGSYLVSVHWDISSFQCILSANLSAILSKSNLQRFDCPKCIRCFISSQHCSSAWMSVFNRERHGCFSVCPATIRHACIYPSYTNRPPCCCWRRTTMPRGCCVQTPNREIGRASCRERV